MTTQQLRAKLLRKNSTQAEKILWHLLRKKQLKGYKFRRQTPLGNFIVDFICYEARLIVELDGRNHVDKRRSDLYRTECLESMGFRMLRFWNYEVCKQTDAVIEKILEQLSA